MLLLLRTSSEEELTIGGFSEGITLIEGLTHATTHEFGVGKSKFEMASKGVALFGIIGRPM